MHVRAVGRKTRRCNRSANNLPLLGAVGRVGGAEVARQWALLAEGSKTCHSPYWPSLSPPTPSPPKKKQRWRGRQLTQTALPTGLTLLPELSRLR